MTAIELSAGTIEYTDSGGDRPDRVMPPEHGARLAALIRDFISAR